MLGCYQQDRMWSIQARDALEAKAQDVELGERAREDPLTDIH